MNNNHHLPIFHNGSDVENNGGYHNHHHHHPSAMSAGIAAGDSTIDTREGIGLMPRRKSNNKVIGANKAHFLHPNHKPSTLQQPHRPPNAISFSSPPQSFDSRSDGDDSHTNNHSSYSTEDDDDDDDHNDERSNGHDHGSKSASSASASTITFHHHQYQSAMAAAAGGAGGGGIDTIGEEGIATTTTNTGNNNNNNNNNQNATGQNTQQQKPPTKLALDLKHNDNAFYVIASLIVDRFADKVQQSHGRLMLSATDKEHLDRVVPRKHDFIHALQFRITTKLQEHSTRPIDVMTRQCRSLGLHRDGNQNPLLATIGSLILINSDEAAAVESNLASIQTARPHGADELARQQLLAELREASTLMAESVTPEASQFWRKHVIELQAKLRALQKASAGEPPLSPVNKDRRRDEASTIMQRNEQLLASLWQNTGYVPPSQDEMTEISNSVTAESRAPSIAQNNNINSSDPRDMELPMIDVVAPADLPAGYQFEAAIDNNIFTATVPMGGVKKGQTFSCYMKDVKEAGIPYGHWKDGFFDIFKYGSKHPMLLNSVFCPLLALAQVMARLGLDYTGQPLDRDLPRRGGWSARGMMACVIVFWLGLNSMIVFGFEVKLHNFLYLSMADILSLVVVNSTFVLFTIYATVKTRKFLQDKYQIDQQNSPGRRRVENILLSTFCLPLTIAQMGRHTASYNQYDGVCCNETGIPIANTDDNEDGGVIV